MGSGRSWMNCVHRGYVTTRVLVPEQDLSTGTLKLSLIPGVIRQLRFADASTRGTWKSAFPTRGGDVLNLRDLEQGLEQMKHVPSQDVDMQIAPTEVPGESDVVISVKRTKPWSVVASVDNSGQRATGKLQGNLSLGLDNPLGLNDVFNIGANQDLEFGDKHLGSHGFNSFYSVPWGYWTATVSGNSNTYYQQIAGVNQTFVSSGNQQTLGAKLQRVLTRGQNDVFGVEFQLSKRWGASFIDDTEIPQQYTSWLNQVENWFARIQRDVIARGVFTTVKDLDRKLMRYIREHNKNPKPIKWKYNDPSRRIRPVPFQ